MFPEEENYIFLLHFIKPAFSPHHPASRFSIASGFHFKDALSCNSILDQKVELPFSLKSMQEAKDDGEKERVGSGNVKNEVDSTSRMDGRMDEWMERLDAPTGNTPSVITTDRDHAAA